VTGPRLPVPHALALTLCLGLAAGNAVRLPHELGVVTVVVLGGVAAGTPSPARIAVLACALVAAGWWWSTVRLDALDRSVLVTHVGESGWSRAVVTGPARRGSFALRVPAKLEGFGRLRVRESILLELPLGRAPPQGARVELVTRIALPRPPSNGFDERSWLRRQGVHVVAHGGRWRRVGRRGGLPGVADRLHLRLARTIAPGLTGERRGVVAGIVLGEDEGLSPELRDRFRASGLYHLLAVSGQNVAFLALGVLLLARLVGIGRRPAEVAVLAVIAAYVLAVGWQPSVVRAGVAGWLASLAWLSARPRDRWYFLLVGAIVLLAWNPYSLLEPGFQLSFAAVCAIFLASERLQRRLEGYPLHRALREVVAVSFACGLATAPIVWLQFGAIPLYTVPANALAFPVVSPLLGLGLATALLAPILPGAAVGIAWANGWLAAYLAGCARVVGGLPHAQITSWAGLALLAAIPAFALALGRVRARERRAVIVLVSVAAITVGAAWRLAPRPAPPPLHGVRVTFLDVGQGDSALVQTASAAVLVDEGPPEARVARQLARLGVRRLSLVVLTHPQRDHVGGAAEVLAGLDVDAVLDPGLQSPSPDEDAAMREARRRRVPVILARAGNAYRLGRLRIQVVWPDSAGAPGEDPNQHAVVLLVSYGELDVLLTADAEADVTTRLHLPPVEVLKVAHHGSVDTLLPELLDRIRPRVAVISVGRNNDYGHPTPSTLAALARQPGLDVYRTDQDGAVTVDSDGRRLSVSKGG
jgi:competence protein ComEC